MLDQQILAELIEIRKNLQLLVLLLRADQRGPDGDWNALLELEKLKSLYRDQELTA